MVRNGNIQWCSHLKHLQEYVQNYGMKDMSKELSERKMDLNILHLNGWYQLIEGKSLGVFTKILINFNKSHKVVFKSYFYVIQNDFCQVQFPKVKRANLKLW